jgi:hypothetical protein
MNIPESSSLVNVENVFNITLKACNSYNKSANPLSKDTSGLPKLVH